MQNLTLVFLGFVISFLALNHCRGKDIKQDYSKCEFSYNPTKTVLNWTAFKFTEKVGVPGKFEKFSLDGTKRGSQLEDIFQNSTFTVDAMSLNTGNPERDEKIKKYFFGTLKQNTISGKFIFDNQWFVELNFNGKIQKLPVRVEKKDDLNHIISLNLEVNSFGAEKSLKKLNEVCYELHKGSDGKSKLWPDVLVTIETELTPHCPN